ncbi:disulfide oxidoreductase [Lederbergia wuyishanensis]|uniref:Disulfide bond formation protein DsbB n=1 Tax=Lederbergia wuyishanensis TaxID=1347903 RepID=A0ABU0CYK3_9BACI|nr:disulfide oxidoreductase [Lederbergia wuyishanensis]MCJ8005869.1 disulfide oxidoreductase [Lederbergia wuyishanensis]MDQ0341234.1 disulfide bond formation protein DsbB [Lederbergia wuyishanensis]
MENKSDTRESWIFYAFAVSVIALLGSLYFSEILKYTPCDICWYIRILMYPIVIILGIATVKKDYNAALYAAVFSGICIPVSLYLYMIQKIPTIAESVPACGTIPCTTQYINWLGFITIPFLALTAFIMIFISSIL